MYRDYAWRGSENEMVYLVWFYAGYYGGDQPGCFEEHISLSTLQAAVSVKAAIGFVLYPAFPTDDEGFTEDFYETIESEAASTAK